MSQRRRSACFFDSGISFSVFPADGSSDNSFLVKPYIAFSQKIGFRNENRDIFNGIYIVNIDSVSMLDSEEKNVSFKFNLNSTHDTLFFKPDDRFKAEESYSIGIKYSLDISEDEGQTFNAMLKDGKEFSGSFTSSFKIRPYALPQAIDTSNVELAILLHSSIIFTGWKPQEA